MNHEQLEQRVNSAIIRLIHQKGYICAVDVLMESGILAKKDYEAWRNRRVPYLERVCHANLSQLSAVNHLIRSYAVKNELKPSYTAYMSWGKGKKEKLRFSKTGNETIEKNYATHYVSPALKKKKEEEHTDSTVADSEGL